MMRYSRLIAVGRATGRSFVSVGSAANAPVMFSTTPNTRGSFSPTWQRVKQRGDGVGDPRKGVNGWFHSSTHPRATDQRVVVTHTRTDDDDDNEDGDSCYEKAMEAIRKEEEEDLEREKRQALEQYEAMMKINNKNEQQEPTTTERKTKRRSKASGMAVVRTIARQVQRKRKIQRVAKVKRNRTKNNNDATEPNHNNNNNNNDPPVVIDWYQRQVYWLERAAFHHQHPKAYVRLGNMAVAQARAFDEPIDRAKRHLRLAQDYYEAANSPEGFYNLGHLLWTGFPKDNHPTTQLLPPDRPKALQAFEKAVAMGDKDALYFCGVHMMMDDTTEDLEHQRQGLDRVQRAADDHDHGGAAHYLALLHLNGHPSLNIDTDYDLFARWLNLVCARDHPETLFVRGHCHLDDDDAYNDYFHHDRDRALRDFARAGALGHADAAVSAGALCYEQGRWEEAYEHYQTAADMGSREGWRNVVRCYLVGEGVPRSESMAEYIANTMLKEEDEEEDER